MNNIKDSQKKVSKFCFNLFILYLLLNGVHGVIFEALSKITTSDKIKNEGYPAEEHEVVTDDGYVLTIYRIPGNSSSTPVVIQHGFLASSFDWVVAGKNKALAFVLADAGYDVWLGNVRGTSNGRRHTRLDPSDPTFWNFSIHEMGVYDLPAIVTYITDMKNSSLIYVGHSMGTTISYIMATERPDMTDRVKVIFSFAPIAIMRKWTSPVRLLTNYTHIIEALANRFKTYEIFAQNAFIRLMSQSFCQTLAKNNVCLQLMFFIAGYNPSQLNYNIFPMIWSHVPSGTSVKNMIHLTQMGKGIGFRMYDYGPIRNNMTYNSLEPPEYNLSKIQIPVGIFWSDNDLFSHPLDAQAFYKRIPRKVLSYRIPLATFSHSDFMWAKDASSLVYSKLVSVMEDYRLRK